MKHFLQTLFFFSMASLLFAQNPTLSLQGVLRDNNGNAVDDSQYPMTFRFYDVESGGSPLSWSENHASVTVVNGTYNVILGSESPFSLPFDKTYFLSVEVDGTVMEPRIPLTLSPYSLSVRGTDNVFPSSGNVGIGIKSPSYDLDILEKGSGDAELMLAKENAGAIRLVAGSNTSQIRASHDLKLVTSSMDRMTIKESGKIGIGTTDPVLTMDLRGGLLVTHGTSYDVWMQGGSTTTGGDERNLALLGYRQDNGDKLVLNYGNEYANGVQIQSNATVTKDLVVSDDIQTNGGLWVPGAADANLRIVHGWVNSSGSVVRGSGYTATHDADGKYTVTFSTAFRSSPVVVACPAESAADGGPAVDNTVGIGAISTTGFKAYMVDIDGTNNGDYQDCPFSFIAIGVK